MTAFTLHVISCGHGDTLLLQLPNSKWALVDCHLPEKESLSRFFEYAESLGVNRLDYIVLTHPDSDHYQGMCAVLAYFSQGGRSLGYFCAAGASPRHVMLLLASRGVSDDDVKEYAALARKVHELQESSVLKRQVFHDQAATVRVAQSPIQLSFVAVGPDYNQLARAADAVLMKAGPPRLKVNECSIVLVAQLRMATTSRRLLFPGDMEGDGLSNALLVWDSHSENADRSSGFDVLKAPHHGSINGHDTKLADRIGKAGESVFVISCGTSYGLPNRTVVSDYACRGWQVYCTTQRSLAANQGNAMQSTRLAAARQHAEVISVSNVIIRIDDAGQMSVAPETARIEAA